MLCDGCPRAYHLACMRGVGWGDLPAGEWHCPRCAERRGAALRKLAEFEARKHEALERWAGLAACCGSHDTAVSNLTLGIRERRFAKLFWKLAQRAACAGLLAVLALLCRLLF